MGMKTPFGTKRLSQVSKAATGQALVSDGQGSATPIPSPGGNQ